MADAPVEDKNLLAAWAKYNATPEYANTFKWLAEHRTGSAWALFLAGYEAAQKESRELLLDSNEVLRSTYSIAVRSGKETNWEAFLNRVERLLKRQHAEIYKK